MEISSSDTPINPMIQLLESTGASELGQTLHSTPETLAQFFNTLSEQADWLSAHGSLAVKAVRVMTADDHQSESGQRFIQAVAKGGVLNVLGPETRGELLLDALTKQDMAFATTILEVHGTQVNSEDADGATPLVCAASMGDIPLVTKLLGAGALPSMEAIERALEANNVKAAEAILVPYMGFISGSGGGGESEVARLTLHSSLKEGHVNLAGLMLVSLCPPQKLHEQGCASYHDALFTYSLKYNFVVSAEKLVSSLSSPDLMEGVVSAIESALQPQHMVTAMKLIDRGAQLPNASYVDSLLDDPLSTLIQNYANNPKDHPVIELEILASMGRTQEVGDRIVALLRKNDQHSHSLAKAALSSQAVMLPLSKEIPPELKALFQQKIPVSSLDPNVKVMLLPLLTPDESKDAVNTIPDEALVACLDETIEVDQELWSRKPTLVEALVIVYRNFLEKLPATQSSGEEDPLRQFALQIVQSTFSYFDLAALGRLLSKEKLHLNWSSAASVSTLEAIIKFIDTMDAVQQSVFLPQLTVKDFCAAVNGPLTNSQQRVQLAELGTTEQRKGLILDDSTYHSSQENALATRLQKLEQQVQALLHPEASDGGSQLPSREEFEQTLAALKATLSSWNALTLEHERLTPKLEAVLLSGQQDDMLAATFHKQNSNALELLKKQELSLRNQLESLSEAYQKEFPPLETVEPPDEYLDCVTASLMADPVTIGPKTPDSQVFDRSTLMRFIQEASQRGQQAKDPFNNTPFDADMIVSDGALAEEIGRWRQSNPSDSDDN